MKCTCRQAKDADLGTLTGEEVHKAHPEGTLVKVEHVEAHRSKKEKQMSSLQKMNSEG